MAKKKELNLEEAAVEEPVEEEVVKEEAAEEKPAEEKKSKKVKAKVVVPFRDIHNGTAYRAGETIEVTQKRFDEINSKKTHVKRA